MALRKSINQEYKKFSKNENLLLDTFQTFFKQPLFLTPRYHSFDYTNDNSTLFIELKTRTVNSDAFLTTILPYSKIEKSKYYKNLSSDIDIIFCFCFTDGIKYIKYDQPLFSTYTLKDITRKDRGTIETHINIPIEDLDDLII